jgi:Family of unknown function (DUF6252)
MKKSQFLAFLIIIFFIAGCQKKDCCTVPNQGLYLSALKNGSLWSANPGGSATYGDTTVVISGSNLNTNPQELLAINIKFNGTGNYQLKGNHVIYSHLIGGDGITSDFKLNDAVVNTLTVTDYDPNTKTMAGTFNITVIQTYGNQNSPAYPQTFTFLNGKFRVQLK